MNVTVVMYRYFTTS